MQINLAETSNTWKSFLFWKFGFCMGVAGVQISIIFQLESFWNYIWIEGRTELEVSILLMDNLFFVFIMVDFLSLKF